MNEPVEEPVSEECFYYDGPEGNISSPLLQGT